MKKSIMLAASFSLALFAHGQGTVNFNTRLPGDGIDAPVTYGAGGFKLDGADGWKAQLYMSDIEHGSFAPVGSLVSFRSGAFAGYLAGGVVEIPGRPNGTTVFLRIGVWNIAFGATYEEAMFGFGAVGISNPIAVTLDGPPNPPPNLVGIQPFYVIIPEPSTFALTLAGVTALLGTRKRPGVTRRG